MWKKKRASRRKSRAPGYNHRMPEPSPRKRFKIHLSTVIVLTIAAGGFIYGSLYANIHTWEFRHKADAELQFHLVKGYGWPLEAYAVVYDDGIVQPDGKRKYTRQDSHTFYGMLAVDFTVLLFILTPIYFFCEWLLRRRAPR